LSPFTSLLNCSSNDASSLPLGEVEDVLVAAQLRPEDAGLRLPGIVDRDGAEDIAVLLALPVAPKFELVFDPVTAHRRLRQHDDDRVISPYRVDYLAVNRTRYGIVHVTPGAGAGVVETLLDLVDESRVGSVVREEDAT
jgi:hypothetical protein